MIEQGNILTTTNAPEQQKESRGGTGRLNLKRLLKPCKHHNPKNPVLRIAADGAACFFGESQYALHAEPVVSALPAFGQPGDRIQ